MRWLKQQNWKGAEADLILGIGKHNGDNEDGEVDNTRFLTISKNKLSGFHGTIPVMLEPDVAVRVMIGPGDLDEYFEWLDRELKKDHQKPSILSSMQRSWKISPTSSTK